MNIFKRFIFLVGNALDREQLRSEALLSIEFSIQPALSSLATFLEAEYLPNLRPEIGLSTLPGIGKEFYDECLKFHTSTNMTVTEIHELGLTEVDRIEEEMKEIITELGYSNLTLQQFSQMIRWYLQGVLKSTFLRTC